MWAKIITLCLLLAVPNLGYGQALSVYSIPADLFNLSKDTATLKAFPNTPSRPWRIYPVGKYYGQLNETIIILEWTNVSPVFELSSWNYDLTYRKWWRSMSKEAFS